MRWVTSVFSHFPSLPYSFFKYLQVAIIAGNFDLAEIIKVHKASDVGKCFIDLNVNVVSGRHQTEEWLSVASGESQGK